MRMLTKEQVAMDLARAIHKPILHLGFDNLEFATADDLDFDDVLKAAPYLSENYHMASQMVLDGCGYIVCDDEEELDRLYNQTVGDDGPTATNLYDGWCKVYALTINAQGVAMNENT